MIEIDVKKITVQFDFKQFDLEVPVWFENKDCITQYVGIWKIFLDYVIRLNSKKVLEFGTREGYSTRMFSEFLKFTGGQLITVDINPHKIDDVSKLNNVTFIQKDVFDLEPEDWNFISPDILYIDDWHNAYHLYSELDRFAKLAKVVMIHDVCQDWVIRTGIMNGLMEWCKKEFVPYTIYPLNGCGLAVIEIEKC